jgi:hypothetical protein
MASGDGPAADNNDSNYGTVNQTFQKNNRSGLGSATVTALRQLQHSKRPAAGRPPAFSAHNKTLQSRKSFQLIEELIANYQLVCLSEAFDQLDRPARPKIQNNRSGLGRRRPAAAQL